MSRPVTPASVFPLFYEYNPEDNTTLNRLPNGERFFTEGKAPPLLTGSLTGELCAQADNTLDEFTGRKELRKWASHVLTRSDLTGKQDADYWGRAISKADSWADKVFPHWFFLLLKTKLEFPYSAYLQPNFTLAPPQLLSPRPDFSSLKQTGFNPRQIEDYARESPPILMGKFIPFFDWLDDEFGVLHDEFTLVREGSGEGEGGINFPGGHTKGLLDLPVREFFEEAGIIRIGDVQETLKPDHIADLRFLAVIDQVLLTKNGQLKHYWINVFSAGIKSLSWLNRSFEEYSPQELLSMQKPLNLDGKDHRPWKFLKVDPKYNLLPGIQEKLNLPEAAAWEIIQKFGL